MLPAELAERLGRILGALARGGAAPPAGSLGKDSRPKAVRSRSRRDLLSPCGTGGTTEVLGALGPLSRSVFSRLGRGSTECCVPGRGWGELADWHGWASSSVPHLARLPIRSSAAACPNGVCLGTR